ncbi:MAG: hypothetical protein OXC62_02190 [Aestuariivita sp.]|nr:hypothetical protein [Aestuariivita sp.]
MSKCKAYVGMDIHRDTIAVALATPGRPDSEWCGAIANRQSALQRLIARLAPKGETLSFCYETGPGGYGVYREMTKLRHLCDILAPGGRGRATLMRTVGRALCHIAVMSGLRLGMRTPLAVDQSTYLVESSRSQKARSSASVVNSGIGFSFFDIQGWFFMTHDTC